MNVSNEELLDLHPGELAQDELLQPSAPATFKRSLRNQRRIDELFAAWSVARAEANLAYEQWRTHTSKDGYAVYLAAEDRADIAQDLLASASAVKAT